MRVAHTRLFAQYFGRTDAGAHATHDVFAQDRMGRTANIVTANLLNESRNVDARGTRRRARRVVAEVATVSRD